VLREVALYSTTSSLDGTRETFVKRARSRELEYSFRTRRAIKKAKNREEHLLRQFDKWLRGQRGTAPQEAVYGQLSCDRWDPKRHQLIEAKSSSKRELLRMAVGQLLDYDFKAARSWVRQEKRFLFQPSQSPLWFHG